MTLSRHEVTVPLLLLVFGRSRAPAAFALVQRPPGRRAIPTDPLGQRRRALDAPIHLRLRGCLRRSVHRIIAVSPYYDDAIYDVAHATCPPRRLLDGRAIREGAYPTRERDDATADAETDEVHPGHATLKRGSEVAENLRVVAPSARGRRRPSSSAVEASSRSSRLFAMVLLAHDRRVGSEVVRDCQVADHS